MLGGCSLWVHRGFLCVNRKFGSVELRRKNVGRYIKYPKYDALRNNCCVKQFSEVILRFQLYSEKYEPA